MQWVSLAVLIFLSLGARSEENGGGEEHTGGGEAPKAEAEYSGKQSQEWSEVQTKLLALKGKVDAQDAVVKSLIIERAHATGENQSEKIEQLKKEHQKLMALVADFNKLNQEYETKFPEKGIKESRIYKRIDAKSIERIENDMTLEGRMNRLQKKVLSQYPKAAKKIEEKKPVRKQNEEVAIKRPPPPTLRAVSTDVTEPLILKK